MRLPFFGGDRVDKMRNRVLYSITPLGSQKFEDYEAQGTNANILAVISEHPCSFAEIANKTHLPFQVQLDGMKDMIHWGWIRKSSSGDSSGNMAPQAMQFPRPMGG